MEFSKRKQEDGLLPISIKIAAQTISGDLVSVKSIPAPTNKIFYMDIKKETEKERLAREALSFLESPAKMFLCVKRLLIQLELAAFLLRTTKKPNSGMALATAIPAGLLSLKLAHLPNLGPAPNHCALFMVITRVSLMPQQ